MMKKYKIVETADAQTLENKVNGLIEKGYRPLGGMRVILTSYSALMHSSHSALMHYQTLILEDNYGETELEFQEKTNPVLRN